MSQWKPHGITELVAGEEYASKTRKQTAASLAARVAYSPSASVRGGPRAHVMLRSATKDGVEVPQQAETFHAKDHAGQWDRRRYSLPKNKPPPTFSDEQERNQTSFGQILSRNEWKISKDAELALEYAESLVQRDMTDRDLASPTRRAPALDPMMEFYQNGGWEKLSMNKLCEEVRRTVHEVDEACEDLSSGGDRTPVEEWTEANRNHCSETLLEVLGALDADAELDLPDEISDELKKEDDDGEVGVPGQRLRRSQLYRSRMTEIQEIVENMKALPKQRRRIVRLHNNEGEISDYSDVDELEEEYERQQRETKLRRATVTTSVTSSNNESKKSAWRKLGFIINVKAALRPKTVKKEEHADGTLRDGKRRKPVSEYHNYFNERRSSRRPNSSAPSVLSGDSDSDLESEDPYRKMRLRGERGNSGSDSDVLGVPLRPRRESIDDQIARLTPKSGDLSSQASKAFPTLSPSSSPLPESPSGKTVVLASIPVEPRNSTAAVVEIEADKEAADAVSNVHQALAYVPVVTLYVKNNGTRRTAVLIDVSGCSNVKVTLVKAKIPRRGFILCEIAAKDRVGVALLPKFDKNRSCNRVVKAIAIHDPNEVAALNMEALKFASGNRRPSARVQDMEEMQQNLAATKPPQATRSTLGTPAPSSDGLLTGVGSISAVSTPATGSLVPAVSERRLSSLHDFGAESRGVSRANSRLSGVGDRSRATSPAPGQTVEEDTSHLSPSEKLQRDRKRKTAELLKRHQEEQEHKLKLERSMSDLYSSVSSNASFRNDPSESHRPSIANSSDDGLGSKKVSRKLSKRKKSSKSLAKRDPTEAVKENEHRSPTTALTDGLPTKTLMFRINSEPSINMVPTEAVFGNRKKRKTTKKPASKSEKPPLSKKNPTTKDQKLEAPKQPEFIMISVTDDSGTNSDSPAEKRRKRLEAAREAALSGRQKREEDTTGSDHQRSEDEESKGPPADPLEDTLRPSDDGAMGDHSSPEANTHPGQATNSLSVREGSSRRPSSAPNRSSHSPASATSEGLSNWGLDVDEDEDEYIRSISKSPNSTSLKPTSVPRAPSPQSRSVSPFNLRRNNAEDDEESIGSMPMTIERWTCHGAKPNGIPWRVLVLSPMRVVTSPRRFLHYLNSRTLSERSVSSRWKLHRRPTPSEHGHQGRKANLQYEAFRRPRRSLNHHFSALSRVHSRRRRRGCHHQGIVVLHSPRSQRQQT